jgi:hypothetical protein
MDPNADEPHERNDGPFDDRREPDPFDDDTDVEDNPYVDDPSDDYGSDYGGNGVGTLSTKLLVLLVLAGIVLFVIPEPLTSTVGLVLLGIAAVAWGVRTFL